MNTYEIIAKKRDNFPLSKEEIEFMVNGYVKNTISDYQVSAWLMAICINGMNKEETSILTEVMLHSGDTIDLSAVGRCIVDKHSTGGVGDKTTLILAPIVASLGVPVAKMSGRGLGFTGGTIDKLEAIPGYEVNLPVSDFIAQVQQHGLAVVGQTGDLVPADKKIYALRDVTGTVESTPLIASSIMSKKLASGANKIVLDVKTGQGAFMKDLASSKELAKAMVEIGCALNKETIAIISSMEQPLGFAVGNSLEIIEVIETLKGNGPADLTELSLMIAAYMLKLAGKAETAEDGYRLAHQQISNGEALAAFRVLIEQQKGNSAVCDDYQLFPQAQQELSLVSASSGYIHGINAQTIGKGAMLLGAGRQQKEDCIDLAAGVVLMKKIGDFVQEGDTIATLYYNPSFAQQATAVKELILSAIKIQKDQPPKFPLIHEIIS